MADGEWQVLDGDGGVVATAVVPDEIAPNTFWRAILWAVDVRDHFGLASVTLTNTVSGQRREIGHVHPRPEGTVLGPPLRPGPAAPQP